MAREPKATLGERIKQARLDAGSERGTMFTQTELARLVGVKPATVSQWEAGASEPVLATILAIAAALGVAPGPLAFGALANRTPASDLPPIPHVPATVVYQGEQPAARKSGGSKR